MNVTKKANLTAKDMVELLRNHYLPEGRPPAGIFASEIGSPDGKRFADALWQSTTRSGGLLFVGHEIKVSRPDVAVELADPTKAELWMQYCDQWWLTVSDPSLIDGMKIPDAWGVMAPPSGRRKIAMTVIKEAPVLKPVSKEPGLVRLMTWHAKQNRDEIRQLNIDKITLERRIGNLERDNTALKNGRSIDWEEQKIFDIYHEYKARIAHLGHGFGLYSAKHSEKDDIVNALVDLRITKELAHKIDSENRTIFNTMSSMKSAIERMAKIEEELLNVTRLEKK